MNRRRAMPARPAPGAAGLLSERARTLYRHLPHALAGEPEAVHQLRVAARRLRVTLPLVALKGEGRRVRQARRDLRDLTRAAAVGRDLDVMLEALAALLPEPGASAKVLLRHLREAQRRSRRRLADALLDQDLTRLRRDLRAVQAHGAAGEAVCLERALGAARAEAAELRQALGELEGYDARALHRLRIGLRRLRYTTEVVDAVRGSASQAPRLLREQQQDLGRVHDLWMLSRWLQGQARRAEHAGHAELAEEARARASEAQARSERVHRDWLEGDPSAALARAMYALESQEAPCRS